MFNCNTDFLKNAEANRERMRESCMNKCSKCNDNTNNQCDLCTEDYKESNYFCGCVGYGYVPWHYIKEVYCAENALSRGTVFPELDLPIEEYGKVCKRKGNA